MDKAIVKENEHLYYKLIVGNDYKAGTDIIIKALPLDDDSDPDIFISKVYILNIFYIFIGKQVSEFYR